jgi:hypothetical protein
VWTLPGKRFWLIHSKTSLPLTCLSFQRSATEYQSFRNRLKVAISLLSRRWLNKSPIVNASA